MQVRGLHLLLTYKCNARCRHCFLNSGPDRTEVMAPSLARAIVYDNPGDINYWNYWADWGAPGVRIDDPIFYGDDHEEPQEVSLLKPSDEGVYKVMVDFHDEDTWRNNGRGGEAFIDVWIADKHIGQYRSGLQHEDTIWTPVEIDIPFGEVRYVNEFN